MRKTFGEYEVKCASWERAISEMGEEDRQEEEAGLELLRLTKDGQGVLGELILPGVLRAAIVLAASRKILSIITSQLSGDDQDDDDEDDGHDHDHDHEVDEVEDEDGAEDEQQPDRFDTFEKNSFRSPKFWLAWNGTLVLHTSDSPPSSPSHARKGSHFSSADSPPPSPTLTRTGSSFPPPKSNSTSMTSTQAEGLGYITFTGNDCRKFKGTLNCKELGWKDVAFSGFKSVSRSECDRAVLWSGRDVETGWKEGDGDEGDRGARLDSRRRVVFD